MAKPAYPRPVRELIEALEEGDQERARKLLRRARKYMLLVYDTIEDGCSPATPRFLQIRVPDTRHPYIAVFSGMPCIESPRQKNIISSRVKVSLARALREDIEWQPPEFKHMVIKLVKPGVRTVEKYGVKYRYPIVSLRVPVAMRGMAYYFELYRPVSADEDPEEIAALWVSGKDSYRKLYSPDQFYRAYKLTAKIVKEVKKAVSGERGGKG